MSMITVNSPEIEKPEHSLLPLWSHQKKMVYRCLQIESSFNQLEQIRKQKRNPMAEDIPETFGIMADKPGTGKTFVAVSLILSDLKRSQNQCNLIVVPQNIYTQWDKAIKGFCDLEKVRYKTFIDYSEMSKLYADPNMLTSVDILLTTSLYYHMICGTINTLNKTCGLKIGRVFFDEIDTINSMLREPVESNFTWFISASFKGDKIGCYKVDKLSERTCKCEDRVIDASFNLYPPVNHIYKCKSVFTGMLCDILPDKKISELNALDYNTNIYRVVRTVPKNEAEFVKLLLLDIEEIFNYSKTNIENLLKAKKDMIESGFYAGQVLQAKVGSIMKQVNDSHGTIVASKNLKHILVDRLKALKVCFISFEQLEQKERAVLKCCQCLFSKEIMEKLKKYHCTVCDKDTVYPDDFMIEKKAVLINPSVKSSEEELHKLEVFAKIIKDLKPEQKIIIFSDYPSVFKDIETYFEVKNIKFVTLDKGTITEIDKSVEKYKNGDAQILIADSTMYGCGMNFENTTDIILIHKINSEMEKQVIGRAQRPGRKSVLQIHRLLHQNEL